MRKSSGPCGAEEMEGHAGGADSLLGVDLTCEVFQDALDPLLQEDGALVRYQQ